MLKTYNHKNQTCNMLLFTLLTVNINILIKKNVKLRHKFIKSNEHITLHYTSKNQLLKNSYSLNTISCGLQIIYQAKIVLTVGNTITDIFCRQKCREFIIARLVTLAIRNDT